MRTAVSPEPLPGRSPAPCMPSAETFASPPTDPLLASAERLYTVLEKLTSGAVGKLISPDYFDPEDKRPIFDWMTVFRQGGIVYAPPVR